MERECERSLDALHSAVSEVPGGMGRGTRGNCIRSSRRLCHKFSIPQAENGTGAVDMLQEEKRTVQLSHLNTQCSSLLTLGRGWPRFPETQPESIPFFSRDLLHGTGPTTFVHLPPGVE